MAELMLKIGEGAGYEDGDVLCAFNRRKIRSVHAQHLCHPRKARRNGAGLILSTELAHDWYEATHQYRFERVSKTEIDRVTIATGDRERLSAKPNAKGEAIDVPLFISRRKRRTDHCLFGADGKEVWYGGRIDFDNTALDRVWAAVEAKTGRREAEDEFQFWPAGAQELKSHLFVPVTDFSDQEAEVLVSPWIEPAPTPEDPDAVRIVRKRNMRGNWRSQTVLNRLGVSRTHVLDRTKQIDRRRGVAPLDDVLLLWHKREARPAKRLR